MLRHFTRVMRDKTYRVRDGQRKINCPHPDYQTAFIVLPAEWLGKHAIRRDAALKSVRDNVDPEYAASETIADVAVALAILDDWKNIPGIEGNDPNNWRIDKVPIPVMAWIVQTALTDYANAYIVPKVSSEPSQTV